MQRISECVHPLPLVPSRTSASPRLAPRSASSSASSPRSLLAVPESASPELLAPLPRDLQPCDVVTLAHLRHVLLAIDDCLVADSVLRLLSRFLPHAEVQQVRDRVALRESLAVRAADFLIASEALLDGDALDLLAEARARRQCDRLLVLTQRREPQVIFAIRSLGAHGAVDSRSDGASGLADAIRRIGCGGAYWSQSFLEILRGEGPNGHVQRVLSPAELYVFAVLGDGSDDQTGADVLGLSLQSVHAYRKRIHQKLRLQHKGQLVSLAIRCGLVRFTERGVERPGIEALRSRSVFRSRHGAAPRCPSPSEDFEASPFQAVAEPASAGTTQRGQKRVTMPSK